MLEHTDRFRQEFELTISRIAQPGILTKRGRRCKSAGQAVALEEEGMDSFTASKDLKGER